MTPQAGRPGRCESTPNRTGLGRLIVSAVMANLVFSAGLVAMLRHRKMIGRFAILFRILNIMIGVLIAALSMTHGLKAVALANSREFWVKFQPSYFCPGARRRKEPQKGIAGDIVRMFQSTMPQLFVLPVPFSFFVHLYVDAQHDMALRSHF